MLSSCFMDFYVGVGAFVIGLCQISSFFTIPGVSDYDIVSEEVQLKPQVYMQVPRKVPLFRKTDWDGF